MAYAIVIGGGIWNRYSKKVDTDRNWYFLPTAIFAVIGTTGIMGIALFDSVNEVIIHQNWIDILAVIIVVGSAPIGYAISSYHNSKMTESLLKKKAKWILEYDMMVVAKEFEKGIKPFKFK
jgi:hypothetical protein